MMKNRSMPGSVIIPELPYADVRQAADWLCRCFGFVERLQIGEHRAQLSYGMDSIILTSLSDCQPACHSILVRITDVDGHHARLVRLGGRVLNPPTEYPYGERQYTAEDLGGHRWTFSQTIQDVDPGDWGGVLFKRA